MDFHLLKSSKITKVKVRFHGEGTGKIIKPQYIQNQNIIKINETQFFDNITHALWTFEIGKDKIIQKWLKRKVKIDFKDTVEFSEISSAIYETLIIQNKINKIYPDIICNLIEK